MIAQISCLTVIMVALLSALPESHAQGSYSGPPQSPVFRAAAPVAYAQPQPLLAGVAKTAVAVDPQYDPNPQYNYAYSVSDALTGDQHNHQEARSGDVVQGQYSLVEPDGSLRVVTYHADPVNGFNAVVSREGAVRSVGPAVAKVAPVAAYAAHPAQLRAY